MLNSEEIKPVALAIIELHLSEGSSKSVGGQVGKSVGWWVGKSVGGWVGKSVGGWVSRVGGWVSRVGKSGG